MERDNKRGGLATYANFIPPSPYEQERRRAEQQRRYAELLQQQALAEEEPFTYQGIRAMPSPLTALTKMLQAYGSKKALEKAEEAEQKAKGLEEQAASQISGRLFGGAPLSQADTTPDESGLAEVAIESAYRQDPMDAMRVASTPQGAAAVKSNPMLAAMLTKSMEQEKAAKSPYGSVDPSKFTTESLQAFDASVRSGKPDYTVLQPREYAELTPQQQIEAALGMGRFGIEGGRFTFETGQTAPQLRFPFQSQRADAQPAVAPPQAAVTPSVQPAAATSVAANAAMPPQAATPNRREALSGALEKTEEKIKPLPAIETAPEKDRIQLRLDFPKAQTAAQVGLGKLDQLDAYLADLENHAGLDRIAGKFNQYEVTDFDPSALSARSLFNVFLQGTSIQSVNEARQASTTGGAFGTMTEKEWPRLEGAFGAVVAAKDPNDLRRAIRNARKEIDKSRNRYKSAWESTYGNMDMGYVPPDYEPESTSYPRAKPKQSESRSIADKILEEERNRTRRGP